MSVLRMIRFAACIVLLLGVLACNTTPAPSIERSLADIAAKNLKSYNFDPTLSLVDRVAAAPDFVLKYLREMDKTVSYTAYVPTPMEKDQLSTYLGLLPDSYRETLQQRLIGIYFINKWIGSGMADYVLDEQKHLYAILVINPETMRHSISEWVTYRENTAFQDANGSSNPVRISIDCGTKYTGLMYLLLHETSHIMDYVHRYTPYVEDNLRQLGPSAKETSFTNGIWTGYDTPAASFDFKLRRTLSFYGLAYSALIPLSQAMRLYQDLQKTPFASLYGSRNWAEDFAEFSCWYHFTTVLGQPYRILLSRNGVTELTLEPMKSVLIENRTATVKESGGT
jgi:hypothetical protein